MSGAENGTGKVRGRSRSAKASLSFDIYLRAAPQQVRAVLADPALAPRWPAYSSSRAGRKTRSG